MSQEDVKNLIDEKMPWELLRSADDISHDELMKCIRTTLNLLQESKRYEWLPEEAAKIERFFQQTAVALYGLIDHCDSNPPRGRSDWKPNRVAMSFAVPRFAAIAEALGMDQQQLQAYCIERLDKIEEYRHTDGRPDLWPPR